MKTRFEHATTSGLYRFGDHNPDHGREFYVDQPTAPDGDGWRLVAMAVDNGLIFWSWEREAAEGTLS